VVRAITFPASAYAFIREVLWVLEGSLTFVEGEVMHTLTAGDCLEVGPATECVYRNDQSRPCVYAVVVLRHLY
jgi:mannose-6-phosphate isomerase-like protein (cupin superfamily)